MKKPILTLYALDAQVVAFSTTRHGGYSSGQYGEFNINRYCGDDEDAISRNREALCQWLGIGKRQLLMPHQVHQTKIVKIDERLLELDDTARLEALEDMDAIMTDVPGVCIGVSTADCIPLLLFDKRRHVVCAVHAGWRGTVQRIAEKAVTALTTCYGSQPSDIVVQIGPGISLANFEVGDEVYEAFHHADFPMEHIARRYPTSNANNNHTAETRWHIDLPMCNRLQLLAAGLPECNIDMLHVCTYEQHTDYFSARRLGIHSGRIFTGIMLKA